MKKTIEVYHECFGGCIGLMEPELYTSVNSSCIRCTECNRLFSTNKFVSHYHSSYFHSCHLGFDSTNWRMYIMLVDQKPQRELLALWDSMKNRFNPNVLYSSLGKSDVKCQDGDFAYLNSPDHKKAMGKKIIYSRLWIPPLMENLHNRKQAASASVSAPQSLSSLKYTANSHSNSGTLPHDRTCLLYTSPSPRDS